MDRVEKTMSTSNTKCIKWNNFVITFGILFEKVQQKHDERIDLVGYLRTEKKNIYQYAKKATLNVIFNSQILSSKRLTT